MSSIFDIFSTGPSDKAASDQIAGLQQGYGLASGDINQAITSLTGNYGAGSDALKTNYTAALQPFLTNNTNANVGVTRLMDVLGLNGPNGSKTALDFLRNSPGYQFAKTQGDDAINAANAASGKLGSGNQILDLSRFNTGLADQTYNNYVGQLTPFLGQANASAAGIGNIYTGLGSSLNANSVGLGNATAGQYDTRANLGWALGTGTGNAKANDDLSAYNASGNIINAIGSGLGAALPLIFSDERLKEDIEPVGEMYDGSNIYRYRYKGDPVMRIGVIAQEVEKKNPAAVVEIAGFKAVDYGKATQYASELSRFLEAA